MQQTLEYFGQCCGEVLLSGVEGEQGWLLMWKRPSKGWQNRCLHFLQTSRGTLKKMIHSINTCSFLGIQKELICFLLRCPHTVVPGELLFVFKTTNSVIVAADKQRRPQIPHSEVLRCQLGLIMRSFYGYFDGEDTHRQLMQQFRAKRART